MIPTAELINDLRMFAEDIFSTRGTNKLSTTLSLGADRIEVLESYRVEKEAAIEAAKNVGPTSLQPQPFNIDEAVKRFSAYFLHYGHEHLGTYEARVMFEDCLQGMMQPVIPEGWKEAAIAWEVCRSIHEQYAKKKDPFYTTRQSDFVKHAGDARAMLAAAQEAQT